MSPCHSPWIFSQWDESSPAYPASCPGGILNRPSPSSSLSARPPQIHLPLRQQLQNRPLKGEDLHYSFCVHAFALFNYLLWDALYGFRHLGDLHIEKLWQCLPRGTGEGCSTLGQTVCSAPGSLGMEKRLLAALCVPPLDTDCLQQGLGGIYPYNREQSVTLDCGCNISPNVTVYVITYAEGHLFSYANVLLWLSLHAMQILVNQTGKD